MLLLFTSAAVKSLFQSLVTMTLVPEHTVEVYYVSRGIHQDNKNDTIVK